MSIYYVYAYLRNSNNTPYYIGKGHSARMFNKNHSVSVPSDRSKIVVLAENLSNTEACDLERSLIRQYGRKDLSTGILHNRTDGGEGAPGFKQTQDHINSRATDSAKAKRSKAMKGRKLTESHRLSISKGNKGVAKSNTTNMKYTKSASHSKNISLGKLGKKLATVECPYCEKIGGRGNMLRYHFENCKHKPS
jgi:hypothetical protein